MAMIKACRWPFIPKSTLEEEPDTDAHGCCNTWKQPSKIEIENEVRSPNPEVKRESYRIEKAGLPITGRPRMLKAIDGNGV